MSEESEEKRLRGRPRKVPPLIVGKPFEIVNTAKEYVREKLSFRELVELFKGSQDVVKRANVILNPLKPQTSTNLSDSQVDFIAISMSITKYFPEFEPLKDFADQFLLASVSKGGWGVDRMIQHEQAIAEKRMVQLGLKSESKEGTKAEPES